MELKFAMGQFTDAGAEADLKILLSLPQNKADGNLLFLMGRCREEGKNDLEAKHSYEDAIKYDSPRKIEACQRLATLLRRPDRLNDPKAADQVIDEMVQSSPDNYQVYLARGRYRRQYGLPDARNDIEKALKLAGDKPEIVLEMAGAAATESGQDEARKILEAGPDKNTGFHRALSIAGRPRAADRPHRQGCRNPRARSEISGQPGRPPVGARQLHGTCAETPASCCCKSRN